MLEIACFNVASAIIAAEAGADRIELCSDYAAGGVTPSLHTLREICKATTSPINVMIRPRPGNFEYSDEEIEQMKSDIRIFKSDANGFVFGLLNDEHGVNMALNRQLVQLATPLPCTFHRAFDQVPDMSRAAQQLIECGFTSVLTSGGPSTAASGAGNVAQLQKVFGEQLTFILGGAVRSDNIQSLRERSDVPWYHSAAITKPGEEADADEVKRLVAHLQQSDLVHQDST